MSDAVLPSDSDTDADSGLTASPETELSVSTAAPHAPDRNTADLRQVVEALLFASSKPLTARQVVNVLTRSNETHGADYHLFKEVNEDRILDVIVQLREEYANAIPSRGLHLQQIAGGFRFGTRPETATWVRQLFDETRPTKLSQPALETLSIIAYRQPISRADVEAVRGVAVDGVVTTLLERRLIKLAGRSEAPGRPLLYETTPEFLETFGLKALDELPNADELRRIPLPVQPATAKNAKENEAEAGTETGAAPAAEAPASETAADAEAPSAPEAASEAPSETEAQAETEFPASVEQPTAEAVEPTPSVEAEVPKPDETDLSA